MSALEVWAPFAKQVELVTGGRRLPLEPDANGTFRLRGSGLPPGTDYMFSLDGGEPLPDPRARHQPGGVRGPSRSAGYDFAWSDARFRARPLESAVLYEIHVGTFTENGTFDGVIERLPHLQALGVTHIELMPVADFPGLRGWGYDGVHLFAPHRAYGGPLGLKRLVDACHAADIGVLLDVVYNHLGPDGNVLPRYGPYLTDTYHTPWGAALNLDGQHAREVRRFLADNALYWLGEFHFDGLRLDAVHALLDRSACHFLRQLSEEVKELARALGKPLVLIAESDLNDPRLVRSPEAGGFGLDAQWSDDFHHALHAVLTGERHGYYADYDGLADLARALERGFVYAGQYSAFRQRCYGAPLGDVSLRRLVASLQNHDQVGNRARGERIGHLASPRRVRLGAALLLLGPFVPLLFQGEEWNASAPFLYFTDHEDPGLARATSQGRQREFEAFGWNPGDVPDPQAEASFRASCLDFRELARKEHASVFEFYRTLLGLRKNRPELSTARVRVRSDESRGYLVMEREASSVAVNFGDSPVRLPARAENRAAFELVYANEGAELVDGDFVLPPESVAVAIRG